MDKKLLSLPFVAFGVVFLAAATLQPVIGTFTRVYHVEGGSSVSAADFPMPVAAGDAGPAPTATPRPLRASAEAAAMDIPTATTTSIATPAAQRTGTPASTTTAQSRSATRTPATMAPAAGASATPGPAATITPGATSTAEPTSTPTPTFTATALPTATATLPPTATPIPTATPDACRAFRDGAYAFLPADQTLRVAGQGKFSVTLQAASKELGLQDAVIRVTVSRGAANLTRLVLAGDGAKMAANAGTYEFWLGAVSSSVSLDFEFTATFGNALALDAASVHPADAVKLQPDQTIELRAELTSKACPVLTTVVRPSARVQIVGPSSAPLTPKLVPAWEAVQVLESEQTTDLR